MLFPDCWCVWMYFSIRTFFFLLTSRTHSKKSMFLALILFSTSITTFCETPFAQLLTPHSLFIEFTFNQFVELSIQHLVHHVSRFHSVRFESNEGNCRYILIHSSLWCNKISWMRCRHWSSGRWGCHWRPSTPSQWNPSLTVQSHWSTDCPRSFLHPIHHCPQPRCTRDMCSSQWESIACSV